MTIDFQKKFPDRHFEFGIAEQNMISHKDPVYIRLTRQTMPDVHDSGYEFKAGVADTIFEPEKKNGKLQAVIFASGGPVGEAVAAAVLLSLLPAAARAQLPSMPIFDSGMRSVGLQLGSAHPTATHGFRQVAASGIGVNIVGWHYLFDWIAAGAEIGMSQFGKNPRGKTDAVNLGVLGRVNLYRQRTWSPYILGGIGYHMTNVSVAAAKTGDFAGACNPVNGACGDSQGIKAKGTSITAGLGVEKFLFQGLSVSLESRFREHRFSATSVESYHILLGVHFWLPPKEYKR